jgi:dTDP-4-dehydrorhamnose reductase
VRGYNRAIYSGLTTQALAQVIMNVIQDQPQLTGLYHVSAEPITKYDLLCLLNEAFKANVEIEPFPEIVLDRSLDSRRFRAATGFVPPAWPDMLQAMADDPTPYTEWRGKREL